MGVIIHRYINAKNEPAVVEIARKNFKTPKQRNKKLTIKVTTKGKGKRVRYPFTCDVDIETDEDGMYKVSDWKGQIEKGLNGKGLDIKKGIEKELNKAQG